VSVFVGCFSFSVSIKTFAKVQQAVCAAYSKKCATYRMTKNMTVKASDRAWQTFGLETGRKSRRVLNDNISFFVLAVFFMFDTFVVESFKPRSEALYVVVHNCCMLSLPTCSIFGI